MTSETPLAVAAAQRLLQRKGGVLEPLKSPYEWLGIDEKGRLFRAFLGKLYGISKKRGYIIGIYIIGIYIYDRYIYIYNRYIYIYVMVYVNGLLGDMKKCWDLMI
jgi:hypothetical protein